MRVSSRRQVVDFSPVTLLRFEYLDVMNKTVAERNALGAEGWECFCVVDGYGSRAFYFKRPLP